MKILWFLFFVLTGYCLDLEDLAQDFVLETKQIKIPEYPEAFNPSIVKWKDQILLSFRIIPDPMQPFTSMIGLILLDKKWQPIGKAQILQLRSPYSTIPCRAEDSRLLYVGEQLYIVYSDHSGPMLSKGGFRMVIAEVHHNAKRGFYLKNMHRIVHYPGANPTLREKNWVPFAHENNLMLAYQLSPHTLFQYHPSLGICTAAPSSPEQISWDWGILRGGTPALMLDSEEYLSIFHSVKKMETKQSNGKMINHYFMGAYTFEAKPPFRITKMSQEPIIGNNFYQGKSYKPYWFPTQCVFPCGMIIDEETIWISYGRQDHELWIAKLDKKRLLSAMIRLYPS